MNSNATGTKVYASLETVMAPLARELTAIRLENDLRNAKR